MLYRGSNGEAVSFAQASVLGSGGEGNVYLIPDEPGTVAKIYHRQARARGAKLLLMVKNPPARIDTDGHPAIAWPLDTLHTGLPAEPDNLAGFIMRHARSMKPIGQCFNPSTREREFPSFTYRHLCVVALNLAQAVARVHGGNYVIGDINESNALVGQNGMTTLIDTDSFQLIDEDSGAVYRNPVGKLEYTPGDLQGQRFDMIDREQYHDRFGLGVIIFQLLMEGRHPFSGIYSGPGEPPDIGESISAGYFVHGTSRTIPLKPGPGYMPWSTLSPEIAQMFRLCFDVGHENRIVRPTAFRWYEIMLQTSEALETCAKNGNHVYIPGGPGCPWCERRTLMGGHDPYPRQTGRRPRRDPAGAQPGEPVRLPVAKKTARQRRRAFAKAPRQLGRRTAVALGIAGGIAAAITVAAIVMAVLVLPLNRDAPGPIAKTSTLAAPPSPVVEIPAAAPPPTPVPTPEPAPARAVNDVPVSAAVRAASIARADLIVTGVTLGATGEELDVVVVNAGGGRMLSYGVALYVDGNTHPYAVANYSDVMQDNSATLRVPWYPWEECHEVEAVADFAYAVAESDEMNNRSLLFTICAQPPTR